MFNLKILILSVLFLLAVSCVPKYGDAPEDEEIPTKPALTPSQISGSHIAACMQVGASYGTDVSGMSMYRVVTLNGDGTYHLSIFLFTGSVCQMGGTQVFNYTQWGHYTLGAVSSRPMNATQVIYTTTANSLTIYAASSIGSTWAEYFNNHCPGGPTNFSTTGTSSRAESGVTCSSISNPAFSFPTFPADGSVFYDVILLTPEENPTSFSVGTPVNIFIMGQFSGFPDNANYNFSF